MNKIQKSTTTVEQAEDVSFWSAWRRLKREKGISTQAAMILAQDRYPQLYSKFLSACERQKR
ncbi:MAG: hypothetical protein H0X47_09190 [Nitrospirales bacterium]|nr:hypothetical protein [Nitrospirales bacterium]